MILQNIRNLSNLDPNIGFNLENSLDYFLVLLSDFRTEIETTIRFDNNFCILRTMGRNFHILPIFKYIQKMEVNTHYMGNLSTKGSILIYRSSQKEGKK